MKPDSRKLPRLPTHVLSTLVYDIGGGRNEIALPLRRHLRLVNLATLSRTERDRETYRQRLRAHHATLALDSTATV